MIKQVYSQTGIKCPTHTALPSNLNAIGCSDSNFHQSQCTYECDEGFSLVGSDALECTQDAVWSDELPTCQSEWFFIYTLEFYTYQTKIKRS